MKENETSGEDFVEPDSRYKTSIRKVKTDFNVLQPIYRCIFGAILAEPHLK